MYSGSLILCHPTSRKELSLQWESRSIFRFKDGIRQHTTVKLWEAINETNLSIHLIKQWNICKENIILKSKLDLKCFTASKAKQRPQINILSVAYSIQDISKTSVEVLEEKNMRNIGIPLKITNLCTLVSQKIKSLHKTSKFIKYIDESGNGDKKSTSRRQNTCASAKYNKTFYWKMEKTSIKYFKHWNIRWDQ